MLPTIFTAFLPEFFARSRSVHYLRVISYSLGAYTYTRYAPVSQLLGPGCDQAALAEELYVYATATDGWNGRLYWLDVYAPVKAFALTPEE